MKRQIRRAQLRREAARKYRLEPDGWAARSEVWWFAIEPRSADPDDLKASAGT